MHSSDSTNNKFRNVPAFLRAILLLSLLAAFVTPTGARGQTTSLREYEIKAAYLYNFINYIDWPANTLPPAGGTITIGIIGVNPFGAAIDPLNGKQVKGRTIAVKQLASAKEAGNCQIVFISSSEKARIPELLAELKDARALTVGEVDGFAQGGGIINFVFERNKVRFEINPDAAKRTGLTISSELLKLARLVKSGGSAA